MHAYPLSRGRLAASVAVLAFLGGQPPAALADAPPGGCRMEAGPSGGPLPAPPGAGEMLPFPGHGPAMPPAGIDPSPPHWRRLGLDEAQQDKVLALVHEQMPHRREQLRAAAAARQELGQLAAGGGFDPARARVLAEAHGRAVAALALMEAELDARVRSLLTGEQRSVLDAEADRKPRRRAQP